MKVAIRSDEKTSITEFLVGGLKRRGHVSDSKRSAEVLLGGVKVTKEERLRVGFRVEGETIAVRGNCSWGRKVGGKFDLSGHNTAGLCGFFYHDIFPYIIMLQFSDGSPPEWGDPEAVELECMGKTNAVKIRLRRIRE